MNDAEVKAANAEKIRKQYHPALCNAMELELYYDRDLLEFSQSVVLNTLPREIDFLVIRRVKPGVVKSELGKIFRKCNIWEFKGYREELSVQVFHKTMSYAYEYVSVHKELDGINDVTLSFLREGRPRDLMRWLEAEGFKRLESPPWVARYSRDGYPDIQIVNIAHPEAPKVLRILSHKAEPEDIRMAAEYISQMPEEEQAKSSIVLELSYRINGDRKGGTEMGGFFEAYVDPLQEIIKKQSEELEQKDEVIEQKDEALEQKDAELEQYREELARKDEIIAKLMKQGAVLN